MKKLKITFILILIVVFGGGLGSSFAEDIGNLINQQNEIKQKQDESVKDLEIVKSDLSANLQQIQALDETIAGYETDIKEWEEKANSLETSITDIESKLKTAQSNYDKQKELLDKRLVTIYEAGEINYLDVLLNSKNITEFIANYFLVTELTQYDMEFISNIEQQKRGIENNKKKLENQKTEYIAIKENKQKTAIILQNSRAIKNSYMAQLTEEEKKIQEDIENYKAEIAKVESEILAIAMQGMDSQYIGGVMAWPVPGYTRITSPFGMRTHPITGVYKLHTGVDIGGAPIGADFIAANDGIVVKAERNTAYGNMVLIDHGGGISTLYAHGNEIVVSVGQEVKKGEVVLKVGSTGYSTGPHAHFEVRVNGSPVDPMPYITTTVNTQE